MVARPGGREKTVVMMVWNTCENDSRVIKEATALSAAGYEVTVVCLSAPHLPRVERHDGVSYIRTEEALGWLRRWLAQHAFTTRNRIRLKRSNARPGSQCGAPPPSRILASLYRVLTLPLASFTMNRQVLALRPDVIHAHDLQVLPAASRLARRLQARLIYDSHELAAHVSILFPRPIRWLIETLERRYIRRADQVITVSPGIANHLASTFGIPLPAVLYNSPPTAAVTDAGGTVRTDLGIEDDPVVVYVGGLAAHRGLEQAVAAIALLPGFHLTCVGPRREEWEAVLRLQAREAHAAERVHFLDPVPVTRLTSYLSDADVGVVAIQDVCLSYRYSLPNKLFEAVLAGLPVVVNDLPDMRSFVDTHGVGRSADCSDPAALAQSLQSVVGDPSLRPVGHRLSELRSVYGWEGQARLLLDLYSSLLGPRSGRGDCRG